MRCTLPAASEQRAGDRDGALGRRVAEPVTHRDDAFDVPYLLDHVMADTGCLRHALHGDDAVLNGDREAGRVGEQGVQDDPFDNVVPDVRVRPGVNAQHVGPGYDPDEATVVVDYRKAL